MSRRPWGKLLLLVVGALAFLAGCAGDAELDTLEPKGPDAASIDDLTNYVMIGAGIIFVLVVGGVLVLAIKGRVKDYEGDHDVFPEQIHGNTRLEIAWTIVPAVILAFFAFLTVQTLLDLNDEDDQPFQLAVAGNSDWDPTIVVVGQQWWWEYRYYFGDVDPTEFDDPKNLPPADIVTAGQFYIPTGIEVELVIGSRDVIHSHWIPALNGKRDAVPGRFAPWKLAADEPGVYFGQCTEFCGLSHARMRMQTVAVTPEEFVIWVDEQMADAPEPTDAAAVRGLAAFESQCSSCHLVQGVNDADYAANGAALVSGAAPNLTHFMSRTTFAGGIFNSYTQDANGDWVFNRNQVEAWIANPDQLKDADAVNQRGMPNLGLAPDTIDDLVAYLMTLGETPDQWILEGTEVE